MLMNKVQVHRAIDALFEDIDRTLHAPSGHTCEVSSAINVVGDAKGNVSAHLVLKLHCSGHSAPEKARIDRI
jgi:hypothetical protein